MTITVHRDKPPIEGDWPEDVGYIRAEAKKDKAIFLPLSLGMIDDPAALKAAKRRAMMFAEMEAAR